MKNTVQAQPPGLNRLFIVLLVEKPGDNISFPPLEDILLNPGHDPVIEIW